MRKKPLHSNQPVLDEQTRRVAPKLAVLIVSEILDLSPETVRHKLKGDVGELWFELAKMCLKAGMHAQADWRDALQ